MRVLSWILLALSAPTMAQTISGTVINGVTHEPVAGATVIVTGQRVLGQRGGDTRTDLSGAFRIDHFA
jgi:hypothetical protein